MAPSQRKLLEEQLQEAGNSLLNPPSAIDELLKLLDEAQDLLENVEQGAPKSTHNALVPLMRALCSNELLRHSDVEVKCFVATCIAEITRISAPDPPYNDEELKEIFQLTVAAFEKLSQVSSRCYTKAVSILHIVAKVRSSLLMLDLGCNALILEMFQHFFQRTESSLPDAEFSCMEAIMTMVIDESEEIPLDLLRTILSSVRKERQTVSPLSWKLGEKVIENCSTKLKPYLVKAVKSMDIALDDYGQIVASVCQNGSVAPQHDNENDSGKNLGNKNMLVKRASNEASDSHVKEGLTASADCTVEAGKTVAAHTKDEQNVRHKSPQTLHTCHLSKDSKGVNSIDSPEPNSLKAIKSEVELDLAPKRRVRKRNSVKNSEEGYHQAQADNSFSVKVVKSEIEPCSAPSKRGRKPNSLMNPVEGYDHSWISSGRKTQRRVGRRKADEKGSNASPTEDQIHRKAGSQTHEKVTEPPSLEPVTERDIGTSSPSQKVKSLGGAQCRRGRKKKVVADLATIPSSLSALKQEFSSAQAEERTPEENDTHLRKESQETIALEANSQGHVRGPELSGKSKKKCIPTSASVVTDKESALPCDPDEISQHLSALKVGARSNNDQSSVRSGSNKCKRHATSSKESTKASTSEISKSATTLSEDDEGTLIGILKRKPTIEKEEKISKSATKINEDNEGTHKVVLKGKRTIEKGEKISKSATKISEDNEAAPKVILKRKPTIGKEEKITKSATKIYEDNEGIHKVVLKGKRTIEKEQKISKSLTKVSEVNEGTHKVALKRKRTIEKEEISKSVTKISEDNEGNHKVVLKRKHTIEKEQALQLPDLGEQMVGSRINVWWPADRMFYEGVISSYSPAKMKHLVLYADGDEEMLNLRKQRWQPVDDILLDVQMGNLPKPEASSDTPQNKKRKTKSDSSKQENAGLSSKRISRFGVSAGISMVECMKSGSKPAGASTLAEPIVTDEEEGGKSNGKDKLTGDGREVSAGLSNDECMKSNSKSTLAEPKFIDEDKRDESQENDGLKDDGQISAGKLETDLKTGIDSEQITPGAITPSTGESPKVDTETPGKGSENAIVPLV